MKTCSKCKQEQTLDNFYIRSDTGRYRSNCKTCTAKSTSAKWKNDPDFRARGYARSIKHQRQAKYGVSCEDYKNLMEKANNSCEICGTTECATGNGLAIDHCHSTGKVRGILCQACNTALGSFRDDPDLIQRAINYIKESKCE